MWGFAVSNVAKVGASESSSVVFSECLSYIIATLSGSIRVSNTGTFLSFSDKS